MNSSTTAFALWLTSTPAAAAWVSRKNHVYKAYAPLCEWIGKHLRAESAVLDGELACLDGEGKPQFNRLLRRRGEPVFVAFDLLWLNGRDLRGRPLLDRKAALRTLIRNGGPILLLSASPTMVFEQASVEAALATGCAATAAAPARNVGKAS